MVEPRIPVVSTETVQAACVAVDGRGVLIESRFDEARTDLALMLIDRGATLVAGDCAICHREKGALLASPVAGKGGRIEVRGIGIVQSEFAERMPVALLVVILDSPPRFPEDARKRRIAGIDVPVIALGPADPAAAIKVALALKGLAG